MWNTGAFLGVLNLLCILTVDVLRAPLVGTHLSTLSLPLSRIVTPPSNGFVAHVSRMAVLLCSSFVVVQVADHAASFNVSLSKGFLVGGDSSGANIAAAIALQARDDPFFAGKPLTGQYLREPAVVHPLAWPEKYVQSIPLSAETQV